MDDNYEISKDCLTQVKHIRIKKNLGSVISQISTLDANGYAVSYAEGDICDKTLNKRYSSEVRYTCTDGKEDFGWPELLSTDGKCHYVIEWQSRFACSQCLETQVKTVYGSCLGGKRQVAKVPSDRCMIVDQ
jgi:hypothetical protein